MWFFFLSFFKIDVELIYDVVLISAAQQILPHILFHYGLSQDTEHSSLRSGLLTLSLLGL